MFSKSSHLTDEELVMLADGEASAGKARRTQSHIEGCPECRTRLAELQRAIADLVSTSGRSVSDEIAKTRAPLAQLKFRLEREQAGGRQPAVQPFSLRTRYACVSLALLAVLSVSGLLLRHARMRASLPEVAGATVPDPRLTPGATRPVKVGEVCSQPHEEVVRSVPGSVRDQVFREYGIADPKNDDYEIDYLIAPGLGGADDIHNLWPEPETATGWNSHDKDVLEERLHQMVCAGEIDLPTAQKAIASDWIKAYRKYLSRSA